MTPAVAMIDLNSGTSIPQLGLGVWQAENDETEHAVAYALDSAGYRHIDTAAAYGNEEGVGRGIAASGVAREDVFLTTKLWNSDQGYESVIAACDTSLDKLGVDYVDLYLVHWPLLDSDRMKRTWEAMEAIAESGKAKAIGVCNFEPHHLDTICGHGETVPAVDQVELHPHLPQHDLRAFATDREIVVESWSPLGGTSNSGWGRASKPNTLLDDPILAGIGEKYGKSIAQVIIRWHLSNGLVVIPKSVHDERISQNIDVFDFDLDTDDILEISRLADPNGRVGAHPDEMNVGAPE
ncbi:aldo/keto reductase [Williamsia sp. MIQD14]|uniref:aldo/keto reductase n=1 Tax=Williamsia sp. MIQD14 TaxID=3425703 RepID=UPI003DA000C5